MPRNIEIKARIGSIESGVHEANALLTRLGIQSSQLIETAYVDMMV